MFIFVNSNFNCLGYFDDEFVLFVYLNGGCLVIDLLMDVKSYFIFFVRNVVFVLLIFKKYMYSIVKRD